MLLLACKNKNNKILKALVDTQKMKMIDPITSLGNMLLCKLCMQNHMEIIEHLINDQYYNL